MTNADKAHLFGIIACVLMGYTWDISIFYNIAIGISIGSAMWYIRLLY